MTRSSRPPAPARRAARSIVALLVAAVLAAAAAVPLSFGFLALPMVGHVDLGTAAGALMLGVAGWCAAIALAWSGLRALRAAPAARGRR